MFSQYSSTFWLICLLIVLTFCDSPNATDTTEPPPSPSGELSFGHVIIDSNNPANPHCKAVGDINRDDFPDVLVASSSGDGLFWYEYPNWTKHNITEGSFSTDMQTGDIDNDGDPDAVIPKNAETVFWYENPRPDGSPGEDSWTEHKIADASAHDLEVADVNQDGRLDVVVRYGDISILLQDTSASWTKIPINVGGRGGLALHDINQDERIDLLLDGYWLEAPEDPQNGTWNKHVFADGWEGLDVGVTPHDLNSDNRVDIIIAPAEERGKLVWYEASADPTDKDQWTEHLIDSAISHIHTFKIADMDLDGDTDVVTAEMHQSEMGRVTVYLNGGNALSWTPMVIATTGSHNLRVTDIDNDRDIDIVGANWNDNSPTGGAIELWRNNLLSQ